MATTFTGHEFYSRRVLKSLPTQLNFLGAFSTDISDEVKDPGEKIQIALVEADAAGTFDRANNNFARPAGTPKKATVTFGDPLITGFAVTAAQARNIQRRWWEGKADLNVNSIAASASTAVTNLITDSNFEKVVSNVGNAASFVKSGVGKIAAAVSNATNKLRVKFSTLALCGEYFYALASSLDANVYGGSEPVKNGVIPGLLGFNKVMLMHGYDGVGFVCEPSAIAFGARAFRPVDDTPYRAVREIKDPESGLTLTLVEYPDGPSGDLSESVTCQIGAAVGDENALVRLTA